MPFFAGLLPALGVGIYAQIVPVSKPRLPLPRPVANAARAVPNHNETAGGTRSGKSLTLSIDVVEAAWRPEGDANPEVRIFAFSENGNRPSVPGPLVRVPQGTEVRVVLRSRIDSAVVIGGLRPQASRARDTVQLAAGATREVRYRLDVPGTYFYWGAIGGDFEAREWLDSQLNGAIVVDPPGGSPPDRVFLLSEWFHPYPDRPFEVVSVINGAAWPLTERLALRQGDSTRFRLINAIPLYHPMHLHGFYYRVTARGTVSKDGPIPPAMQPLMNTDLLPPGGTLTFAFVPTTPGNWLMHCHFAFHMDETVSLSGSPRDSSAIATVTQAGHGPMSAREHSMHGLVVGMTVTPKPGYTEPATDKPKDIRLLVQKQEKRFYDGFPAYGFVVQKGDTVPKADSVQLPGVLELRRGQPVRINVVNNLDEPTGVHWHGLEIPSFPDGVPNWSGMGDRIFRPIAPRDSFFAEFTPPRSGTFPVHSHLNERVQMLSGMYGAIIVSDAPRDLARDHLIVAGGGGPEISTKIESPFALVNGSRFPRSIRLTVGETHRFRIVSIHPDWRIAFTLRNDTTVARWRALAKDGHDVPPSQATMRAAHVEMGPGETADFTIRPTAPGTWRLEVKAVEGGWYIPLSVIVEAPKPKTNR